MGVRKALHRGKPQPEAGLGDAGSAHVRLEDGVLEAGRQTGARVLHLDANPAFGHQRTHRDAMHRRVTGVLLGVAQQIREHHPEDCLIAGDLARLERLDLDERVRRQVPREELLHRRVDAGAQRRARTGRRAGAPIGRN